jgi:hypothetical protein
MYIIPMAWLYVALMMAVAEATHDNGTLLGGVVTFLLYGLGPVLLVVYLMGSPARRKAIKAKDAADAAEAADAKAADAVNHAVDRADSAEPRSAQPDARSHAPAAAQSAGVAPVRKES